ncbi:MAG: substrate-binding domain-containing protein, partial [Paracoccaceae bacterium]
MKLTHIAALAAVGVVAAGAAEARDQIRIVGSSTVFPFATTVAENFGRTTDFPTPVIESTGSGGGLKLFCAGVGLEHPDITNASRRMKPSEFEMCQENGVTEITEVKIGYDGLAVANSRQGPDIDLTRGQLCQALVKGAMEPAPTMWNEIDPSLPATRIEVLGPPPTSGTRDSFEELGLEYGCEEIGVEFTEVREDGVFIESGENDNLIVSKLEANPNALGVFGFSFLDQNTGTLQPVTINGVDPSFETVQDDSYPMSRSMFFYVKQAHVDVVPGVMEYIAEFISDGAMGEDGYLADKGLITLPADEQAPQT